MGNLGEDDLEKLVLNYFEPSPIIVSDHIAPTIISDHIEPYPDPITFSDHIETYSTPLITMQEILETKEEEEKDIEEKAKSFMKRQKLSYKGEDEKNDVMIQIVSNLISDGYDASLSETSWDSSFDHLEGCRVFKCKRKYKYIEVNNKLMKRVVVDLDFKSQFELAKQTKSYKDITEMLPTVFVATDERLRRVVSLVCGEMKKSMKEQGMSRPPWRTSRYMQAKWLPENRVRVSVCKKGSWSWSMFDDNGGGETSSWKMSGSDSKKTKCCFPIF